MSVIQIKMAMVSKTSRTTAAMPTPIKNMDGDAYGDLCDEDKDGDARDNWQDKYLERVRAT